MTPARTKTRMIAGPASPIASPRMTKMPVPMIAPMPSAVRSSSADGAPELGALLLGVGDEPVDRLGGEEPAPLPRRRHPRASLERVPPPYPRALGPYLRFSPGQTSPGGAMTITGRRERRTSSSETSPSSALGDRARASTRRRGSGRRRAPRRRSGRRGRPCPGACAVSTSRPASRIRPPTASAERFAPAARTPSAASCEPISTSRPSTLTT